MTRFVLKSDIEISSLSSDEPLWPNGQGACLRSRRFTVRVCAVVAIYRNHHLLDRYIYLPFRPILFRLEPFGIRGGLHHAAVERTPPKPRTRATHQSHELSTCAVGFLPAHQRTIVRPPARAQAVGSNCRSSSRVLRAGTSNPGIAGEGGRGAGGKGGGAAHCVLHRHGFVGGSGGGCGEGGARRGGGGIGSGV